MKKFALILAALLFFARPSLAQDEKPLLLRQPTVSRTDISLRLRIIRCPIKEMSR